MKNSIYNTVDDIPVIPSAEKIIEIVLSKPELTWAALIDTAFNHCHDETWLDLGAVINCYDFPELQSLDSIAPCLMELSPGNNLRAQVTRLIRHCQGRPMLSFVGTTGIIKDISASWRAMHMVSVVDEQEMLLRFADTRVLSYLPEVLTPSQWSVICGTVAYWAYFNRSGRLVPCDIPALNNRPERVSITKDQLEQFLDASQPDALMALFAESMCDIIPTGNSASSRYRMIKDSTDLAKINMVDDNADVLALAVAAYLTEGKSNADHRLDSILRKGAWVAGSLGDAIVDAEII